MTPDLTKLLDYQAAARALDCSEPKLRPHLPKYELRQRGKYWVIYWWDRRTDQPRRRATGETDQSLAEKKLAKWIANKTAKGTRSEDSEFPEIRLMPLNSLRNLADASSLKEPGVYFLWRSEELVYVGQSEFVSQRISQHRQSARDVTRRYIPFDSATALPVEWPYQLAVEAAYVRALQPPENRRK